MSEIDASKVLLPGEANLTDEEFELIQKLLEKHLELTKIALIKIKHIREED